MAAVRHFEFAKIASLVKCPISACDSSATFRNLHKSENMAPIYSQKTLFNMASVRHLEFEKFRFSFCQISCSEWKFVSVYQI